MSINIRESFNNVVRSDRPESPTDIAFVYLVVILGLLWVYATVTGKEIASIIAMIAFLGTIKSIKVGSDFQKKRKAACDATDNSPATP